MVASFFAADSDEALALLSVTRIHPAGATPERLQEMYDLGIEDAKALLPRKFRISGYPSYPETRTEEWSAVEKNQKILDICITLLKGLVDNGIIEDMEVKG